MPSPEMLKEKVMLKYRKLPGGTDEFTPLVPNADERWFSSLLRDCIMVIYIFLV